MNLSQKFQFRSKKFFRQGLMCYCTKDLVPFGAKDTAIFADFFTVPETTVKTHKITRL